MSNNNNNNRKGEAMSNNQNYEGGTVTVRAFDANAPIDENEKEASRIWSSEGWLDCEAIDGATYVSGDVAEGGQNARLVAFLESNDLDAYAQWLVLTDGSLVAVQSIDLFDGYVDEVSA